jgi:hypothetical protein
MERCDKKAQMKISFGMIFSIILIIVFISFAFFGIKKFINLQEEVVLQKFPKDLQDDVDKLWNSNQGSVELSYSLSKRSVSEVCFENDGYDNLAIKNKEGKTIGRKNIEHLSFEGRVCFENTEGKISIFLEKNYGESEVKISKIE